ncbi:hypothetical protein SLEP1_g2865 [Rubroshorea leprosula]|uniref:Uncharacterized protein n=1 Tax=Rubroshorea leprosula TaxID=152421 RepID=A0AAV5HT52_9ROSI|nr:hypothetical protein SLEP1_g2865 [Rubroshorea leprosula]
MEAQNDYDASFSSTTSWTITGGSLDNTVTVQSSLALITDNNGDDDDVNALQSALKSPLLLCPSSPDSAPCEIKIAFAQKRAVRQVYVRSTAQVFEIYYAPSLQSINEFLCTLHCEAALIHPNGAVKRLDVKSIHSESNSSTSEDDWVEVKAHDSLVVDNANGSLPSNFNRSAQDLYEATAEISDANPCISITLRLLSLQDRGCLFVDEVYVFADTLDLDESENQSDQMGNLGGSTLMAMLAPTFLQLSRTTELRQIQNEHTFDAQEKEKTTKSGSNTIGLLNFADRTQQEGKSSSSDQQQVKLQEGVEVHAKTAHCEVLTHVSDRESKPYRSHVHVESVLDQLASHVSTIEDLLLRFEEKMLKPISSIDARLQRVEQQLEELAKKGQNHGLPSCIRYYAPEFSCSDSDPYSSYNFRKEPVRYDSPESFEKESSSSNSPKAMDHLLNATQPFPSLVVTAPDFPIADAEEEDHAPVANSPKNILSIDDALAFAFADFLSSTSMDNQKYSQALVVKAPDFSNEEDGSTSSSRKGLLKSEVEITSSPSTCTDAASGMDCIKGLESVGEVICSLDDEHFNREAVEVKEHSKPQEEGADDSQIRDVCKVALARHEIEKDDMGNVEASKKLNEIWVVEETEILNQFFEDQGCDGSGTTHGEAENSELKVEATKEWSSGGILQNFLAFPQAASMVDFETPIFDVDFISEINSNMKSPFEALWYGMSVTDYENPCIEKCDDGFSIGEQSGLLQVVDEEETGPATGSHVLLDETIYSVSNIPLNIDSEKLGDYHACSHQEISTASLI